MAVWTKIFLTFSLLFSLGAEASWIVKKAGDGQTTVVKSPQKFDGQNRQLRSIPEFIVEGPNAPKTGIYTETIYGDEFLPATLRTQTKTEMAPWPGSEVRTLVQQGPVENRIDLTIVGDGYTQNEKEKFFTDAERIKNDLFSEKTFSSYLALFNIHAVFVPSQESGLTDLKKKKTALGLYRTPAGSKRAIMPGNTATIERAIALAPDADYPILMANDDFYGGLGGRYAITTRSVESGKIVLRHELGHNFGDVGEEYDGGGVYSGANASASPNVSWKHWVQDHLDVYESKQLSGDYVWQNLNRPYKAQFRFPAGYDLDVIVSSVGWQTADDVHVFLDGQKQELIGKFTADRSFFNVESQLAEGAHVIEAKQNIADGDNVLAFITVFALPAGINKENHHVGAYATFDEFGGKSYRPTFNTCIMREMLSDEFCSVDKENFWKQFLARVKIIDDVRIQKTVTGFVVEALTPPLEGLNFAWYKVAAGGLQKLPNIGSKLILNGNESGNYRVEVQFQTPEVRQYSSDFAATKDFVIVN